MRCCHLMYQIRCLVGDSNRGVLMDLLCVQIPKWQNLCIYICPRFCAGAWRVSHNPLRCCTFTCIWCEHVKNIFPCLLVRHTASLSPSPYRLVAPVFPLVVKVNKKKKKVKMFCSSPRQSVWKKEPLKAESWDSRWGDDVRWIHLPRSDCVLTTGSVLSQWDLYKTSPQGFVQLHRQIKNPGILYLSLGLIYTAAQTQDGM